MNNRINIAKILKNCPKGTWLYSLMYREVKLSRVEDDGLNYPIVVETKMGDFRSFTKDGRFNISYPEAECLLFPSSEMRDWSKLLWKKGDVLVSKDGKKECIFDEFINDSYVSFLGRHYLNCSDESNIEYKDDDIYLTEDFSLEVEDAAKCYINTIQERLGGKLNPENLEIESIKSKCGFKPFDRVLVRNSLNKNWSINLFSYYDKENEDFPYVCINGSYPYCIPYEGNEHLINTTKDY
mgnify:CR=1 FL=1